MKAMPQRWLGRVLAVWIFALPLCAMADTLSHVKETQTLTIAYRESSIPFSYVVEGKPPIGYAIDICLRLADAVKKELKMPGMKVAYVPVNPANRIATIADGKADLECGSTTNNAERRKQVSFTIPHFFATTRMLVRADSGIHNWPDLRNKKVVTTRGTTTVKLLNDRDKVRALNLRLIEGADHLESFTLVEKFEADAFPMDDVLLFGLRANAKDPEKFAVTGDPLSTEAYAIMLRKNDPAFKELIDREMGKMLTDGDIEKIYEKWFKKPIPPNGVNLKMPIGMLMRDNIRFPTDKVGD